MKSQGRRKIKVVHFCNQLGIGGTERSMELFCKYLDHDKYEVFAVSKIYREPLVKKLRIELGALIGLFHAKAKKKLLSQMNARIPNFQAILGREKVRFVQTPGELRAVLEEISPDILHVWYSGTAEPPTSDEQILSKIPVTITTNSFEIQNTAPAHRLVQRFYFPSHWLAEHRAQWAKGDSRAGVFYSPIEEPITQENLRAELGIPKDAFVVGRVGRADPGIHDPISLKAYKQIETEKTFFLALSPPDNMVLDAKKLGIRNFIPLSPLDQIGLSKFYNTIDVLVHARRDGETFGCNIAEAMMHGKPVVSHLTPFMNAQQEVIGDAGFVCAEGDWQEYGRRLLSLKDDMNLRTQLSHRAKQRALELFEVRKLTKRLESIYDELLGNSQNRTHPSFSQAQTHV
ncbi:MAG: glycosyltransferase family 4 protein [Bdellovibrionota bacterium]